jgi:hypothetical protein
MSNTPRSLKSETSVAGPKHVYDLLRDSVSDAECHSRCLVPGGVGAVGGSEVDSAELLISPYGRSVKATSSTKSSGYFAAEREGSDAGTSTSTRVHVSVSGSKRAIHPCSSTSTDPVDSSSSSSGSGFDPLSQLSSSQRQLHPPLTRSSTYSPLPVPQQETGNIGTCGVTSSRINAGTSASGALSRTNSSRNSRSGRLLVPLLADDAVGSGKKEPAALRHSHSDGRFLTDTHTQSAVTTTTTTPLAEGKQRKQRKPLTIHITPNNSGKNDSAGAKSVQQQDINPADRNTEASAVAGAPDVCAFSPVMVPAPQSRIAIVEEAPANNANNAFASGLEDIFSPNPHRLGKLPVPHKPNTKEPPNTASAMDGRRQRNSGRRHCLHSFPVTAAKSSSELGVGFATERFASPTCAHVLQRMSKAVVSFDSETEATGKECREEEGGSSGSSKHHCLLYSVQQETAFPALQLTPQNSYLAFNGRSSFTVDCSAATAVPDSLCSVSAPANLCEPSEGGCIDCSGRSMPGERSTPRSSSPLTVTQRFSNKLTPAALADVRHVYNPMESYVTRTATTVTATATEPIRKPAEEVVHGILSRAVSATVSFDQQQQQQQRYQPTPPLFVSAIPAVAVGSRETGPNLVRRHRRHSYQDATVQSSVSGASYVTNNGSNAASAVRPTAPHSASAAVAPSVRTTTTPRAPMLKERTPSATLSHNTKDEFVLLPPLVRYPSTSGAPLTEYRVDSYRVDCITDKNVHIHL